MHSCKKERKVITQLFFFLTKIIHLLYTETVALLIDGFRGHAYDFISQNDI